MASLIQVLPVVGCRTETLNEVIEKMDAVVKDYDTLYEEMAGAHAEGRTAGYSEKRSGCRFHGYLDVIS